MNKLSVSTVEVLYVERAASSRRNKGGTGTAMRHHTYLELSMWLVKWALKGSDTWKPLHPLNPKPKALNPEPETPNPKP